MNTAFTAVEELLAEGDAEARANQAEYERQLTTLSARLDELLFDIPSLNYSGIGTGDAWPACRYDEVFRAAHWLSGFKQLATEPRCSSYYLKHVAETATGRYISNGSLIAAAILRGIKTTPSKGSPNAGVAIPIDAATAANAIANRTATFTDLVKIEPELDRIASDAKAYKKASRRQRHVCANNRWYGYFEWHGEGLKPRLCRLVGWESSNPILQDAHAYEVAYDALYAMLPNCKNCGCY